MTVTVGAYPLSLLGLDARLHAPHPVHAGGRRYHETNCYADIVIELLHACGHEPLAAMGITLRLDFEGDQWTFFKPAPGDLERLFGVDIHEMQPYRRLPEQVAEQLAEGRTMIVELDAWYLPDTAATSYRSEHVKTSVAVEAIDLDRRRLRYFHNAGLYDLEGDDFRGVFREATQLDGDVLPPYAELVRFDAGGGVHADALRPAALILAREHFARLPTTNPFERFSARLAADLPGLLDGDAAHYHEYAFATVRMAGAGFELGASYVDWLLGDKAAAAVAEFDRIAVGSKMLSFKLARRRAFDPAPAVAELGAAWDRAMSTLDGLLG